MSLKDIKARLSAGEYNSVEMRTDIFYLLTYADRCDTVIARAMGDGSANPKVDEAMFKLVQEDLMKERGDHFSTKETLQIAKRELENIRTWMRRVSLITEDVIDKMKQHSFKEIMEKK